MAVAERSPSPAAAAMRARLIRATQECVTRLGVTKTGVVDIAQTAGVSRPIVYRYFSTRDDLVKVALGESVGEFVDDICGRISHLTDPLDIVVEGFLATFRAAPQHPIMGPLYASGDILSLLDHAADSTLNMQAALRPYAAALPGLPTEELELLAELSGRVAESALFFGADDALMRADDEARMKLRSWFGPIVEQHVRISARANPPSGDQS